MRAIVIAGVLVLLFCAIFYPSTASAICPENYVESVENQGYDYYMDMLDMDWVSTSVQGWFEQKDVYDFSALEDDPIVIAIIDTGINFEHEIFQGKYDENGAPVDCDGVGEYDVFLRDSQGNIISANTFAETSSADDDSTDYHGTHVAGIAATLIHKLNLEKYIKILPIKASYLDNKKASMFDVVDLKNAVNFALENGADVINMSLSDSGVSPKGTSNYDFVTAEMASKAIFVAAAGNGKNTFLGTFPQSSNTLVYYPAGSKNVIGVMNCTIEDGKYKLSSKSNYGSKYDICFPGVKIYSADGSTDDEYKSLSGTSMASPIASFACALKTLQNRAMCKKNNVQPQNPQEIAKFVVNSYTETISKDKFELKVFDFKKLLLQKSDLQIYADKDKVYISESSADSVTFTALSEGYPDLANVSWTVKNESGEIVDSGNGQTFVFEPIAFGCSYYITATLEMVGETLSATTSVVVVFMQDSCIEMDDIKLDIIDDDSALGDISVNKDGSVIIFSGQRLNFSLADFDYDQMSPGTDILWYVNGDYVSSGEQFENIFLTVGEYTIKAKINGTFTSEIKIVVQSKPSIENPQGIALKIVCGVLCGCIVLGFILTLLLCYAKSRRV